MFNLNVKNEKNVVLLAILLCIAAGFLFVSSDTVVKLAREGLPVAMVVWGRFVTHLLIMMLLFPGRRIIPLLHTKQPFLVIVRALLLLISTVLFFSGILFIGLAEANAIMFIAPLFIVALSIPMLGENVDVRRWSAVAIGFLGILLIFRPGFQNISWAYILIFGAAFSYALFNILTRMLTFTETTVSMWFYTALVGAICSSSVVWIFWETPSIKQWIMLFMIGAICTGSQFIIIKAYNFASASLLAPFHYLQIVWAIAYGFIIFGSFPDVWALAGTSIIITSGLYIWSREFQSRKPKKTPS